MAHDDQVDRTDRGPRQIRVRGARVHNLRGIDVDIPLGQMVGIAGVSGSGKSSLALGVLYAEGSRRYLEALSTYTRRRLTQAARAAVDSVEHVPAALALRQRPGVPGVRSTFGTSTELLNSLRLIYSRLARHRCPNGHYLEPTTDVALDRSLTCPVCGETFRPPGAESLAFNSAGACPRCSGTGVVRDVDDATLVPDESLTIEQGAVESWKIMGSTPNPRVVAELGVRTDVPFADLSSEERRIVFDGPQVKRQIMVPSKNGKVFDLNWTYRNARVAVREALAGAKSEKGLARINRFLSAQTCPDCAGSRLSEAARAPLVDGINLAQATEKTLQDLVDWLPGLVGTVPADMTAMANTIISQMIETARRLLELGLGYLSLDRASATLSTGERQRVQLSRAVRNRTTGVLYVLDEPSIGLHPSNVDGLLGVIDDLLADGNSVVVVDHDVALLRRADHLIEIGPGSGADGGAVVATGSVAEVTADPRSLIGPFLAGTAVVGMDSGSRSDAAGSIRMTTGPVHTVGPLQVAIPRGRLTVVTGVSGSGKTTMVLESLVPGLEALIAEAPLPDPVRGIEADGLRRVNLIDSTPIGVNVRSTVATYSGVMDDLRKAWAGTDDARRAGYGAGDFSYNTGSLRCPSCSGTGQISLDVQFLPDVDIVCPDCGGSRFGPQAGRIRRDGVTLPQLLGLSVARALDDVGDIPAVGRRLRTLVDLGLGYLTLGESTPALSGGEAQRLKLASQMSRDQRDAVFVFDEPTVGLHPLDVATLLRVLGSLLAHGATVVVIEHDLDVIRHADHIIDMGPGGGAAGGRIVATGTPDQVAADPGSVTGRYLAR
ncbi:excinuclease ABC subunit UvrA [Acidipropionibacterium virtanenii]|uniref:UvrABC system protein A n=1 Tax=Acidipropionibacterium virtanenii TaxID=2057246 RepID=A0A344US84_9ACTN|nr:excinuclease ABC subunit UvrA [Acidipropionibacterium virtanenii]AXE38132.1 UvrABC system protein A [Acidipropionibacterium virtanenii]